MTAQSTMAIETQLICLCRQLRWTISVASVAIAVSWLLLLLGATPSRNANTITANRFLLTDSAGVVRGEWALENYEPRIREKGKHMGQPKENKEQPLEDGVPNSAFFKLYSTDGTQSPLVLRSRRNRPSIELEEKADNTQLGLSPGYVSLRSANGTFLDINHGIQMEGAFGEGGEHYMEIDPGLIGFHHGNLQNELKAGGLQARNGFTDIGITNDNVVIHKTVNGQLIQLFKAVPPQ